jgi:hypothetical protein
VAAGGVYQVTIDLQGASVIKAQLTVNGVGFGPSMDLACFSNQSCTFTRLLQLNAVDLIHLINSGAANGQIDIGSGITIVRIA